VNMYLHLARNKIPVDQGWPNCGSWAICGYSNLCTRLFELFDKLYICFYFLYLLQSVEILQNGALIASVPYSNIFASHS